MSSITIHGETVSDGRGRAVARAPDRTGRMERPRDPVQVAQRARQVLRKRLRAGDSAAKVERIVRAHVPEAVGVLSWHALVALARRPPDTGCSWCNAFVLAVSQAAAEPTRTAAHRELLGEPCAGCRRRFVVDNARRQARATAARRQQQRATLAGGGRTRRPVLTGTGMLWATTSPGRGEPPPEARALVAAVSGTRVPAAGTRGRGRR